MALLLIGAIMLLTWHCTLLTWHMYTADLASLHC
jgi:hypothetical protein